ncbi:MAG: diguanylate cyclase [Bauldia sp.]|nr:diguanylate cyclase [Bauldia sp.]
MPLAARFSLRTSLLLLLVLVAILAATKQLVTTLGDQARTAEAAQAQLLERAIRSAEREEHLFDDVQFVLQRVAVRPASDFAPGSGCEAGLAALVGDLPWLTSVSQVSIEGNIVCSSLDPSATVLTVADRDYFQNALRTGGFVVSDFLISRSSGLPIVVAALPRVVEGVVESVVLAGIDLDELGLIAAAPEDEANATMVVLLDRNAIVVGASPEGGPFALGENLASSALWATTGGSSGILRETTYAGRHLMVGFSDLPAINGRLIVLRDRSNVLAEANVRAVRSISALVLAALIICLLVWLGGERFILRPLAAMRSAAGRVESGDFARIETKGFVPEFRQLAERFNSMSEELAKRSAELNAANQRLAELALRDGLTDLGNRRAFEERIEQEGERCVRDRKVLSLLLVDIDRFKQFNDHYGHFAGDEALRSVASLVAAAGRRASDFAARIGGEEFALILPDCPQGEALAIARRLVADVAALGIAHAGSEEGIVTVSVGVAGQRMLSGAAVRGLLEATDQALYAAKRNGRNNAVAKPDPIALVS